MVEAMDIAQEFQKTDVGIIPLDWDCKPIAEFTDVVSGGTPSTKNESYWNGTIRWMNSGELNLKRVYEVEGRITEIGLKNSATKVIPERCVLIGLAGQGKTRGTVAMNMVSLCTNQSIASILPCEEVNPDYLYHNLDSRYKELRSISTGEGGRGGLNLTLIKKLLIPLPPTKEEQTAIAIALNNADKQIAELEKLIAKKRNIRQGAMQELLRPKEGWSEMNLGEIALYRRGSFPQPYGLEKWYDERNGMPFVQVFDVDNNMKLKPETKQKISDAAKDKSVYVPEGSIVLTIQGSIGRIAITQYDSYVDRTLLIFKSFLRPMDKWYFMYVVHQKFQIEKKNAPGGTIKTITKEELSKFIISLPPTKNDQTHIAEIINNMNIELELLGNKLEKHKMIKQGMMQNLLTGKIRLV